MFQVLRVFKSLCEEQGLTYYLMGGSLIGAVRHQGFIPWDDDIDVSFSPYSVSHCPAAGAG